jgi:DNA-binding response OmpR family regulator
MVVEDYQPLQNSLVEALQKFGHHAVGVDCAETFDEEAKDRNLDVIVIDVTLPGEDGFSLSRRLRKVQPTLGIIILTAKSDAADKVTGYLCGADMYLTKPVGVEELMAAVKALARRLGHDDLTTRGLDTEPHAIEINIAENSIKGANGTSELTTTELTLLLALARAKDKTLELWQIYDVLGKDEQTLQKSALEAQIYRLRKKLLDSGAGNQAIKSLRLRGYRIYCPIYIK